MNLSKENVIKFIEAMIVENYSQAHKFLGAVIEEKVKEKIKKAVKTEKPFGKGKGKGKKSGKNAEKKAAKDSAFGGKFPQAKQKNLKESFSEDMDGSKIIDLTEFLPDGSSALAALFDFEHYHGGQYSHMYGVRSSGKIAIENIPALKLEVSKAIKIANDSNEIEHEENFKALYKELSRLEKRFDV